MKSWPVKLIRPSALICLGLLLILLLLPDSSLVLGGKGSGGGKKKFVAPVKHLFGVGIGYQRVVHYKPVLVFSKSRRPKKKKKRRPGWGWGGGDGGGRGKTGWSPVIVQHHIYKDSSGPHHRHGGGGGWHQQQQPQHSPSHHNSEHPKRRTKPRYPRPHRHQSYRGWGWRSTTGPARRTPESKTGGGGHHGGYDYQQPHHSPPRQQHHSFHHHPPPTSDDDFGGHGIEWSPGAGPAADPGYSFYGNPVGGGAPDYIDGDDTGGYETEIKEHWNKHSGRPLTPLVFPGTTADSPIKSSSSSQASSPLSHSPHTPSPLHPFDNAPKSDNSVTNIRRDFLKNHLKNFREFQGYQSGHGNHDDNQNQIMAPPGPHYSTTNLQGGPQGSPPDLQYYDDYSNSNDNPPMSDPHQQHHQGGREDSPPSDSYNYDVLDDDGFNWSELNRKMSAGAGATTPSPALAPPVAAHSPNIIYGVQGALPSEQNNVVMNAPVQANMQVNSNPIQNSMPNHGNANPKIFKPSQRIDEMGSGDTFNDPGFFPTFDQFRQMRME